MYVGACCPPVGSTGDAVPDAAEEVDELCVSSGESDIVPDDGVDVMDLPNYWDVKRDWADACLDAEVESDDLPRVVQQSATVSLLHDPRPNGRALARQSVIRPGTGKESFFDLLLFAQVQNREEAREISSARLCSTVGQGRNGLTSW